MAKPVVAITGASGFLGRHAVDYFTAHGWHVVGLVRDPAAQRTTKAITFRKYDLTADIDSAALKGVDAVIHVAYAKESKGIDAFTVNVRGAESMLAACKQQGIKRCIFISSMSSHRDAISIYGKQKFQIENMFKKAGFLAVRPGFLIGDGGISQQIVNLLKKWHVVPVVSGGNQPLQILGIDDLCRALHACAEKDLRGVLTIAHPETITFKDLYRQICRRAHLRAAFVPLPYRLTSFALTCLNAILPSSGIGPENLKGLVALRPTDNRADMQAIGLDLPALDEYLDTLHLESA